MSDTMDTMSVLGQSLHLFEQQFLKYHKGPQDLVASRAPLGLRGGLAHGASLPASSCHHEVIRLGCDLGGSCSRIHTLNHSAIPPPKGTHSTQPTRPSHSVVRLTFQQPRTFHSHTFFEQDPWVLGEAG